MKELSHTHLFEFDLSLGKLWLLYLTNHIIVFLFNIFNLDSINLLVEILEHFLQVVALSGTICYTLYRFWKERKKPSDGITKSSTSDEKPTHT